MARVELSQVGKTYENGVRAVVGADFTVEDGEMVVLVGPSGCGKTTLLRMIAGLETITSGTLTIGGRVMNDVTPKDRDVAMVFQSYALYPHMTVFENLAFGLRRRRIAREEIDRRVRAAAGPLGLTGMLDRRPATLSGGQRQRVALGRALVREPALFLFDEPLSNLDAALRVQMRAEIHQLHTRLGATMIYVTHDQVEAMTLADRIVVMSAGRVAQVGTPLAVYRRPADRFVAGFIGSPSMNFLRGSFDAGSSRFRTPGGGTIDFDPAGAAQLGHLGGRTVDLGLRPEDLAPAPASPAGGGGRFEAEVILVEPTGSETFVHFRLGEVTALARLAGDRAPAPGEVIRFRFDADRLHAFDAESGASLASPLDRELPASLAAGESN